MILTNMGQGNILWLHNPITDVIFSINPLDGENCWIRCGNYYCNGEIFCSGGFCFIQSSTPD